MIWRHGIRAASLGETQSAPREPPGAPAGQPAPPAGLAGRCRAPVSAAYAFGAEPGLRLRLVHHRLAPAAWPRGLALRIAIIADPHTGGPHSGLERLARAVAMANAERPDLAVLIGDYLADHRFATGRPSFREVAEILAGLRAPLGVHAVLGNHDWWE